MPIGTTGVMNKQEKSDRKRSKAKAKKDELPPYEANIPEPTTREELMKHWIPLTLNNRTNHKLLWIGDGGSKVSRVFEQPCPVQEGPERYEFYPQVVCNEGLLGRRGYWEVEYTGWVVIGGVYESGGRKVKDGSCGLGENEGSWGVGWAGSYYQAWHKEECLEIRERHCNTIGVYLDQPAGTMCFYLLEGEPKEACLLYRYQTSSKEKLLPAFWVGYKSSCMLRKKDE